MEDLFIKRREEINKYNNLIEAIRLNRTNLIKELGDVINPEIFNCPHCNKPLKIMDFKENKSVCKYCDFHARLKSNERLEMLFDSGKYELLFNDIAEKHLEFVGYQEKINKAKAQTTSDEAIVCAKGKINGIKALVGVMDAYFMMGSMGSIVGERVAQLCDEAKRLHLPLIIFTASGGARMQEGIISLFQMAKVSASIARLKEKQLYIAVLTDPTTGGVLASFASLAHITLAEPHALIGFAGKRVIESTIKQNLPSDFQTAEFLLEKGQIDNIVERKDMKETLTLLLRLHNYKSC